MNIKLQIVFLFIAIVVLLIVVFWAIRTEKRLKKFFLGKKAKDLEETISILEEDILKLKRSKETTEQELEDIKKKLKKSIRGLGIIRFNPFKDQGSNQSFAISMLDEESNGVVLSSLYSRERMSIFAKPIKNGRSDYELTEEEENAVKKAKV